MYHKSLFINNFNGKKMKKFLLRVLLPSVIIIFVLLGIAELYLRSLPNDFKYKAEYMDEHAPEIKILVIGSSCTAMGVKPSCFDWQPSFSCAYANQAFLYNYLILNKYINEMDSLRCVILDATYAGLWGTGTGTTAKTYVKRYSIYYGLDNFKGFENNYEISASINDIYERLTHKSDRKAFTTCDADGFQSRYFEDLPYDDEKWKEHGKKFGGTNHTLIYRENAKEIYESNTELLKEIITVCKKHGVKVLFVSTPCHPYYYESNDPIQKKIVDSTYNALCDEYDNVKWFDFTKSEDYNIDERSNTNHLNTKGAIKFTKMINDSIIEWK